MSRALSISSDGYVGDTGSSIIINNLTCPLKCKIKEDKLSGRILKTELVGIIHLSGETEIISYPTGWPTIFGTWGNKDW